MAIASTLEANMALARRVPEEINNEKRLDVIDEVFAEDCIEHGTGGDVEGREALKAMFKSYHDAFDELRLTVDDIFAADDRVCMRVSIRGKHVGEFRGIAPTDREVTFMALVISRVEDGKIAERWTLTDGIGMLTQLGVDRIPAM